MLLSLLPAMTTSIKHFSPNC